MDLTPCSSSLGDGISCSSTVANPLLSFRRGIVAKNTDRNWAFVSAPSMCSCISGCSSTGKKPKGRGGASAYGNERSRRENGAIHVVSVDRGICVTHLGRTRHAPIGTAYTLLLAAGQLEKITLMARDVPVASHIPIFVAYSNLWSGCVIFFSKKIHFRSHAGCRTMSHKKNTNLIHPTKMGGTASVTSKLPVNFPKDERFCGLENVRGALVDVRLLWRPHDVFVTFQFGNTCYANAVLQTLYFSPLRLKLRQYYETSCPPDRGISGCMMW